MDSAGFFHEWAPWPVQPRPRFHPPPIQPAGARLAFPRAPRLYLELLAAGMFEPAWPTQLRHPWLPAGIPCGAGLSAALTVRFAGESASAGGAADLATDAAGDALDLDAAGDALLVSAGLSFAGASAAKATC